MKIYVGEHESRAALNPVSYDSFKDFCQKTLSKCKQGSKSGSYFVVSKELTEQRRGLKNIKSSHLLVIDGDKSVLNENSSVKLQTIHKLLKQKNINHCVYSTHSHSPPEIRKFRLILEVDSQSQEQFHANVKYVYSFLLLTGLKENSESYDQAHLWFLPRSRDLKTFEYYDYFEGDNILPQAPAQTITSQNSLDSSDISDIFKDLIKGESGNKINEGIKKITLHAKQSSPAFCTAVCNLLLKKGQSDQTPRQKIATESGEIERLAKGVAKMLTSTWEIPLPLPDSKDFITPVEFPLAILPKSFLRAAKEIANFNLCAVDDIVPGMFPAISGAIGRKAKVQAGSADLEVYPNLGVINVAETGAYKSTIFGLQMKGFFDAYQEKLKKYNKEESLNDAAISILEKRVKDNNDKVAKDEDTKNDLQLLLKELNKSNDDREALENLKNSRKPSTLIDDTTMEKASDQCYDSGGEGHFFASEGQGILRSLSDAYSTNKSNTDFLIRGLTADLLTRGRVGSKKQISYRPVLNMSFFVQPDIYRTQFLNNANVNSSGLAARPIAHMWSSDLNKMKTEDNYELNKDKVKEFWETVYSLSITDDRDFETVYETDDDYNPHIVKPITKVLFDPATKGNYIKLFNSIRKRYAKGKDLEGKEQAVNKCLTLAFSFSTCLLAYDSPVSFFKKRTHTIDEKFMYRVEVLCEYLIQKKLVEFAIISNSIKIKGAKKLLKQLTNKTNLQNALEGLNPSVYSRIVNVKKQELRELYEEGESMLMDCGYLQLIDNKICLNPHWSESFQGDFR